MAVLKGKNGVVKSGGTSVGHVTSFSITHEVDTLETTAMGTSTKSRSYVASLHSFSGSIDCNLDAVDAGQITLDVGDDVSLVLQVDSTSGSEKEFSGTGIITSMNVEAGVGDLVTCSFDFQGSGDLTTYMGSLIDE